MPLWLTKQEVESVLSPADALTCTRDALRCMASGGATMPPRPVITLPEHAGSHLTMPCHAKFGSVEVLCTKVASVYSGRPTQAFICVQHPATGELLAIMDGEVITARRTAAASALATHALAPPDASVAVVFGTGPQGAAHAEALRLVRPIRRILVVAQTPAAAVEFCRRDAILEPAEDGDAAVAQADIVCTCTNSAIPVFAGGSLRPGAHLNCIGSFRPDQREVDAATVESCDVVVDGKAATLGAAGELEGMDADRVTELGAILDGAVFDRRRPCTLYKSVGLAVLDAFAADFVLRKARTAGLGRELPLD